MDLKDTYKSNSLVDQMMGYLKDGRIQVGKKNAIKDNQQVRYVFFDKAACYQYIDKSKKMTLQQKIVKDNQGSEKYDISLKSDNMKTYELENKYFSDEYLVDKAYLEVYQADA